MSSTDFASLKVAELKALCKEKGLAVSGTKPELIARLSGEAPPAKKPRVSKAAAPKTFDKPVFQTLLQSSQREPIVIKRNAHGHFEHLESHLIFSTDKKVIGVQHENEPVPQPLRTQDLELVYKYHFELDANANVMDQPTESLLVNETVREQRLNELVESTLEQ